MYPCVRSLQVRYEFNRPFLEAKAYQEDDALAVEATGYALLTMFRVEGGGVTVDQVRRRISCGSSAKSNPIPPSSDSYSL